MSSLLGGRDLTRADFLLYCSVTEFLEGHVRLFQMSSVDLQNIN